MQVVQLAVAQDHNQDQARADLHQDRERYESPALNAKSWARLNQVQQRARSGLLKSVARLIMPAMITLR